MTDNEYLYEIATELKCHRGLILEAIRKLQKDLKKYQETFKAMKDLQELIK